MGENNTEFPILSLTPKRETGVLNFLQKYGPEYDGRGVVIAILDSGVDPAVEGLQKTSTGLPKVIERYDCSGAGDVDTKTILTPDEHGFVTGFDGTSLKIPETWGNLSGIYHYGVKPLYHLFIDKVRERAETKRKEDNWDKAHRIAAAEAVRTSPLSNNNSGINALDKLDKEEAEAKLEALDLLEKKYKDWGPIIHCFVFRDEKLEWKVCLALSSDLTEAKILGEYNVAQSYIELTKEEKVSISVNVWEDGDRLEIVSMCSGHGTHVASIAAGYFPLQPELNGVAPGAQIVSLSIGDARLGSMETMQAVSRAIVYLRKNADRIKVVNMSYGEHAHFSNGRIGELIRDTIDKYGITWCASAGNHGPALSTVGSPPWLCDTNLIGIGAYISPEMMAVEYSLREKLAAGIYTWSSRGPTLDGDIGVNVSAPGGAITCVPNFTHRNSQLMNGTSMASPHCAGVISLLISAAQARKFPYSPYSIKQALVNGAAPVSTSDPFSTGGGLLQIEKSLEKLEVLATAPERDVRFKVTVGTQKGIYIRDIRQAQKEYAVNVEPIFFKTHSIDAQKKIDFQLRLVLVSSGFWVHPPTYLDMSNGSRTFSVKVDTEGLPLGVNYAKVEAFDVNDASRGAIFTVHVTVVVPIPFTGSVAELSTLQYEPNMITRNFFVVPRGSNSVAVNLKSHGGIPCRLVVHAVTLIQGQCCKSEEFYKVLTLQSQEDTTLTFKVLEEKVIEICIGRWWAESKEAVPISGKIVFKSLLPDVTILHASSSDFYSRLNVTSAFQTEEIQPTVNLKAQVSLLRATSMKVQSLSPQRNAFPEGAAMFELTASYPLTISRPTTLFINCSLLSENLYEGEYESQLWMLFDSNKRMVGVGDAYPDHYPIKVEKGEYVVRLHVRHEKREFLEKLVPGYPNFQGESLSPTLPVLVSAKLQANIPLNVHQTVADLQEGKKGTGWTANVKKGTILPLFIVTNVPDKSLKNLPCGQPTHYFSGTVLLQKDEKRGSVNLRLYIPENPPKLKSTPEKGKEEILEQMRDLKVSWMSKVEKEESVKLYNELIETNSSFFPIYTARIGVLETQLKEVTDPEAITEIKTEIKDLITRILSQVDKNALLAYFASKAPDVKLKGQMDKTKGAWIETHVKRGILFPEELSESWLEATSFCEPGDSKVIDLTIQDAMGRGHWGRALKYLLKSEDTLPEKDKKMLEVLTKLDWKGAVWHHNETTRFKSAIKDYRLF